MDSVRYILFRFAGISIPNKCTIWGPLIIRPIGSAKNISIGSDSFLNTEIRFGVHQAEVNIGKNVQIGPRVMFETMNHGLEFIPKQGRGWTTKSIFVEDEVWIGAGAIITQGVTLGRGCVIASGAVVTKNVEKKTLVGGIPAKLIRVINDREQAYDSSLYNG